MFMLRQTSVKMAVLLHKQANDWFHPLLTVHKVSLSVECGAFDSNVERTLLSILQTSVVQ